ncbi:MAG TPA: phosphatidylglycerophosphatase A [Candidatus Ozemobacteraceae bacterium]|nr:phosphatidylglycerophosphatase A [Candidatus Ozemobacteraceae bacterium]
MTISEKIGTCWTNRSPTDRAAVVLTSGFGVGFIPIAPATFGSLWGIPLFLLTQGLPILLQVILLLIAFFVAIALADRGEAIARHADPSFVIVDEIVGMWITLFLCWRTDWAALITAFLLFRFFDIVKVYPIRLFEQFRGGLGIVMDDVAAGMVANTVLRLILVSGIL